MKIHKNEIFVGSGISTEGKDFRQCKCWRRSKAEPGNLYNAIRWSDMKFWMKKFERSENDRQNTAEGGMSLQRKSIGDVAVFIVRLAQNQC